HEPCRFVMQKLEKEEKIFGTPKLAEAWAKAVIRHPVAYLQHRAYFMWQFLARQNLTMWAVDVDTPSQIAHRDSRVFMAVKDLHDWLGTAFLFLAGGLLGSE